MVLLLLFALWAISGASCAFIMDERKVNDNLFAWTVILCPVVNTLYAIYRFNDLRPFLYTTIKTIKETIKKL